MSVVITLGTVMISSGVGLAARFPRSQSRLRNADWIRALAQSACVGKHPAKTQSQGPDRLQPYLYRDRNLVERFFNKIK